MKIKISSVLASYTNQRQEIEADGATVNALLHDLDRRYPGIRFRLVTEADTVRPHMRIFVNGLAVDSLDQPLAAGDEIAILQALSGG
jgi:MoaD family protein